MTPILLMTVLTMHQTGCPAPCQPVPVLELPCECRGCVRKAVYHPQPGDIVFFRTTNLVWKGSSMLMMCGKATHIAIVVARPDGTLGLLQTPKIGSRVEITEIVPGIMDQGGQCWVRRRCVPPTPQQCANLTTFASAQEGKPYDLAGWMTMPYCRPMQCVTKKCIDLADVDRPSWFCSSLVVGALIAANLIDGREVRPTCICPNDLMVDCHIDLSCGWESPASLLLEKCDCAR